MRYQINNKRKSVVNVTLAYTSSTGVPYQLGYLSDADKACMGLPRSNEYAIRVDGTSASLVKVINGYTAHKWDAKPVA